MHKKIASNTLIQILSKVITAIISVVLIGILTKYLPIELYGSYNKIYSYLWIFAFLADLWLYTIAVREISLGKEKKEKIIGNILTLRTILGLAIWFLAVAIACFLPGYNDTLTLIAIGIVWAFTLVSLINSSLLALMQSQLKMEYSFISLIAGKIVNITLIALCLIFIFYDTSQVSFAFISVFIAGFLWVTLNTYLNFRYAQSICTIRYLYDYEYIKYIFKISLPYGLALFLSVVYFKIDVVIISFLESPDMADISVALYALPMKIVEVLMVLGGFYLNSVLPVLTQKIQEKKSETVGNIVGVSLKILISFGICIFLLGNILAYDIISLISTPEYINPSGHIYNSVGALSLVFWVLLFHFIALVFIYGFIAYEKQSFLLKVNLVVTLVNVFGNILMVPYYSFMGAAVVTLISQILLMLVCGISFFRIQSIPTWYIWEACKSIILWILIYILCMFWKWYFSFWDIWNILVYGTVFMSLYIIWEYFFSRKLIKGISSWW